MHPSSLRQTVHFGACLWYFRMTSGEQTAVSQPNWDNSALDNCGQQYCLNSVWVPVCDWWMLNACSQRQELSLFLPEPPLCLWHMTLNHTFEPWRLKDEHLNRLEYAGSWVESVQERNSWISSDTIIIMTICAVTFLTSEFFNRWIDIYLALFIM